MHHYLNRICLVVCLFVGGVAHAATPATSAVSSNGTPAITLAPQPLSKTFGKKGQLVLHGVSTSAYGVNYKEPGEDTENGFAAVAGMRVGGMFKDRWLLGGALKLGLTALPGVGVAGKVGPFVGFYQPMGAKTGFLPTFELSYGFASGGSNLYNELLAQLSFDFVFHQAEHFALTFGPTVSQTLFGLADRKGDHGHATALFYGVSLGMLGWK